MIGLHGHQAPQKCHIRVSYAPCAIRLPLSVEFRIGPLIPISHQPTLDAGCGLLQKALDA